MQGALLDFLAEMQQGGEEQEGHFVCSPAGRLYAELGPVWRHSFAKYAADLLLMTAEMTVSSSRGAAEVERGQLHKLLLMGLADSADAAAPAVDGAASSAATGEVADGTGAGYAGSSSTKDAADASSGGSSAVASAMITAQLAIPQDLAYVTAAAAGCRVLHKLCKGLAKAGAGAGGSSRAGSAAPHSQASSSSNGQAQQEAAQQLWQLYRGPVNALKVGGMWACLCVSESMCLRDLRVELSRQWLVQWATRWH